MSRRTERIKVRADPARDALVAREADQVLRRADHTLMPAVQFDRYVSALDQADCAPGLKAAAGRRRRYERR